MQTSAGFCQKMTGVVSQSPVVASALVKVQCWRKPHHDGGEEGDGNRQHAVHIVLAGLGQMWRQVATQFVQSIRDFFLEP